jgi:superfamily II DNA or RNA helicase
MVERYPTSGEQRERHEDKFHTHVFLNLSSCLILGEGFGDASLDTLLLTMPISWRGTLAQYVGRLHREHHAKREVIVYDYVESGVSMLARMALKRQSGYRSLGYEIES